MHWTIKEEPARTLSFHDVINSGTLARTHVLHGLTLSRKLRMQLEDPTDVRLVTEISEFHTGNFRPKIEASIEIYERTHLLRLAEARSTARRPPMWSGKPSATTSTPSRGPN